MYHKSVLRPYGAVMWSSFALRSALAVRMRIWQLHCVTSKCYTAAVSQQRWYYAAATLRLVVLCGKYIREYDFA
jgi:hypothetical protein